MSEKNEEPKNEEQVVIVRKHWGDTEGGQLLGCGALIFGLLVGISLLAWVCKL